MEWEAIKGARWAKFLNLPRLLQVLKRHDPEGYQKRIIVLEELKVIL
jgi:hypothetical protein